jgi:outer membrane protein insertion porin family
MPFWFLPKEVGLKGSVYADAGSLYDYKGPTSWATTTMWLAAFLDPNPIRRNRTGWYLTTERCSQLGGVGLIKTLLYPLRFDYAKPCSGPNDRVRNLVRRRTSF